MNITEKAKELRKVLKTRFPDCKFSVISDYNSLRVALMSSFVEFEGETYRQGLNYHYHRQFERGSNEYSLCEQIMETILEILPQYEIDDNPDNVVAMWPRSFGIEWNVVKIDRYMVQSLIITLHLT